jgi:hypothetical protein
MKKLIFAMVLFGVCGHARAQATFKIGWNTYKTGLIIHEFNYYYTDKDSLKLRQADSAQTFATSDSLVTLTVTYPAREKAVYKTANFFNAKKQVVRSEEYRDENLQVVREWKYDEKGRKIYHLEDNKLTSNNYKKNYDYVSDKKTGDLVVTESSYYNGKIEFYTKSYFDSKNVKYKEMRLNDNNKDIIHIESYTYGDNGKVKERSVYFPEFKVTKKFEEPQGDLLPKCFNTLPTNTLEKPSLAGRVAYIKRVLTRNQSILMDKDCPEFVFKFTNNTNCEMLVSTTKVNNGRQVIYRFKERLP